jgi:DNA-binding transcriptional MerR regulator
MDGGTLYSIGDLARRTGLSVKVIRFYSDSGIVPPTARNPAGYRLYDIDAVARFDLVRTLRGLGLDLATIKKVVDREISLPEVAASHAEALSAQIRTLSLRRAVLTAVAKRGSGHEEMDLMHRLAKLSEDERARLIGEFLESVFGGVGARFAGVRRSMTPELPDDPSPEQVEAWVELAEQSQDPDFRAGVRNLVELHVAGHPGLASDPAAVVRDHVRPALAAGIDPGSPRADTIVLSAMARCAQVSGRPDDVELRRRMLSLLEAANDPRRERYLRLLAVVNDWAAPESPAPAFAWFIEALRVRLPA